MRPDEHKKKKNARYKKKHEIPSKIASSDKDKSVSTSVSTSTSTTTTTAATDKTNSNQTNSNQGERNDEHNFFHRKITSNWDRYEEPEEEIQEVGEDFINLIGSAGGAASHFHFKSEKNWDSAEKLDEILAIDFEKLADSLMQIPFCERLGLNEKDIDPSLVKLLHSEVDINAKDVYKSSWNNFSLQDYNFDFKPQQSPVLEDIDSDDTANISAKPNYNTDINELLPDISLTDFDNTIPAIAKAKPLSENKGDLPERIHNLNVDHKVESILSNEDQPPVINENKTKTKELETLEEELDALLLEGTSVTKHLASGVEVTIPIPAKIEKVPDAMNREQEDLEDWLESII